MDLVAAPGQIYSQNATTLAPGSDQSIGDNCIIAAGEGEAVFFHRMRINQYERQIRIQLCLTSQLEVIVGYDELYPL